MHTIPRRRVLVYMPIFFVGKKRLGYCVRTRCGWRCRRGTSASPWTVVFGGCTHGFVGGMKVLLLLAVLPTVSTANPWTVEFGGCTFSGDFDGAPLVRTGSCPMHPYDPAVATSNYVLDLRSKGITSVSADSFQGMSNLR